TGHVARRVNTRVTRRTASLVDVNLQACSLRILKMELFTIFQVAFTLLFVLMLYLLYKQPRERPSLRSVAILVLGDIGRSPRMMYHAESFATNGFETFLIGYGGSDPIPSLLSIPHVHFLYLSSPPAFLNALPFVISAPRKVLHQVCSILHTLLVRVPHPPEFIVVQNPPSIPTLALVWFVAKVRGSKVIIDWHNLGYSILALKLGERHIFVKIAKRFEAYFGRSAYAHLFVTHAMRDYLVKQWNLKGHKAVLHDRPPARFHRTSPSESHDLFLRLRDALSTPSLVEYLPQSAAPYSTPFTRIPSADMPADSSTDPDPSPFPDTIPMPTRRPDRPALLVSSTSWTPDEDFGILLDALGIYEQHARKTSSGSDGTILPKVLVVITGKGPLRERYMRKVDQLQRGSVRGDDVEAWQFVRCISMWLEAEDYPLLLGMRYLLHWSAFGMNLVFSDVPGSADLGVSLHSSSSALDLPMKIVDMFGCGLPDLPGMSSPSLARLYNNRLVTCNSLDELVKDGLNGLIFKDAAQLAEHLQTLLTAFPAAPALAALRSSLQHPVQPSSPIPGEAQWEWGTWAENWDRIMRPLVLSDVGGKAVLFGGTKEAKQK
ncbi:Chitobiosyldiphosphodolichol beta-mannosyltransferase, partial [Grifola frondosa]